MCGMLFSSWGASGLDGAYTIQTVASRGSAGLVKKRKPCNCENSQEHCGCLRELREERCHREEQLRLLGLITETPDDLVLAEIGMVQETVKWVYRPSACRRGSRGRIELEDRQPLSGEATPEKSTERTLVENGLERSFGSGFNSRRLHQSCPVL